jgi:RNA polymerase sigma-70 factor, ECF subfamily
VGRNDATPIQILLQRALEENSQKAWEDFVRAVHGQVVHAIYSALASRRILQKDQVEDLVQDTFYRLCDRNFASLRAFASERPEALGAYLRAVASSAVADAHRKRSAQKRGSGGEAVALEDIENAAGTTASVESAYRRVLIDQIGKCLQEENQRHRDIFWLYYRQGLTAQAISAMPGSNLSPSGVESLLQRLARAVQKRLKLRADENFPAPSKGTRV